MSGTAPAAWHPDPLGRHEFRYWDGTRWTEHVSDRGAASVDFATPPVADGSQASSEITVPDPSPQVLLDAQLQIGMRAKRLLADERGISWGRDRVPFSEITAMAYWVTNVMGVNFDYRIVLWHGKQHTNITFSGRGQDVKDAYVRSVDILLHHPGARMCTEALRSIDADEAYEIAGLTLTRAGIAGKKRSASWGTPLIVRGMSEFPGVDIAYGADPKSTVIGQVSFMQPNGPLVPPLIEACQRRYGRL